MSITALLGAEFWPLAAAIGYTVSAVVILTRVAVVPAGSPVGQLWAVWREGVALLIGIAWLVIGIHWAWLQFDPDLDRAAWSEGLTPWSTAAGFLVGVPAVLDLLAHRRLRRLVVD